MKFLIVPIVMVASILALASAQAFEIKHDAGTNADGTPRLADPDTQQHFANTQTSPGGNSDTHTFKFGSSTLQFSGWSSQDLPSTPSPFLPGPSNVPSQRGW